MAQQLLFLVLLLKLKQSYQPDLCFALTNINTPKQQNGPTPTIHTTDSPSAFSGYFPPGEGTPSWHAWDATQAAFLVLMGDEFDLLVWLPGGITHPLPSAVLPFPKRYLAHVDLPHSSDILSPKTDERVCTCPHTIPRHCFSPWGSAAASGLPLAAALWWRGGQRAEDFGRAHAGRPDAPTSAATFLPDGTNSFISSYTQVVWNITDRTNPVDR